MKNRSESAAIAFSDTFSRGTVFDGKPLVTPNAASFERISAIPGIIQALSGITTGSKKDQTQTPNSGQFIHTITLSRNIANDIMIFLIDIQEKGIKTMNRKLLSLMSLLLAAVIFFGLVSVVSAEAVEAVVVEIQKYGNLVLDLKGSDLLAAGFDFGDVVTVKLNGAEYEMPVVSNYSDVDNGSMLCRVVIKEETNEDALPQ